MHQKPCVLPKDTTSIAMQCAGHVFPQVLRVTPHSQRDRSAVDTLRGMCQGRVWWWQGVPFFYSAFPNLPCWDWSFIK
jgi:hypothetical protein